MAPRCHHMYLITKIYGFLAMGYTNFEIEFTCQFKLRVIHQMSITVRYYMHLSGSFLMYAVIPMCCAM